ncbi:HDL107Wp [Eremothecium sinecaudum]|uniref:HDL107Wp n=1 Tax=Eremothecium sinecaudum TaxID=45286 RepID=A0A0X8HSG6_9SACH|nr:HDL107Wp [Eremothecium sinecaudum]AMD20637.1 HDL107Wp [Eremothecium sinecaudum]
MTLLRYSTVKSSFSYKEKNETDLQADVFDTSDEEGSEDDAPIWLHDEALDGDVQLDSDYDDDETKLNDLLGSGAFGKNLEGDQDVDSSNSDSDDEVTVNNRMKRLQDFVQQSKVYSGIIADTLLQRTKERQEELRDVAKDSSIEEPPAKKPRRNITDFFKKAHNNSEKNAEEPHSESALSQPSLLKNCTLKHYQVEGLNWLITLYENGLNGILADEMGLGKTIQSIALLAFIYEMDTRGPFLITAPLSTVDNWINEFSKFAPDLPCLKYYSPEGQAKRRTLLSKFFRQTKNEGIIITSYEVVMKDIDIILSHHWEFLIVDEGHRLKNINCRLIRELKRIRTSNRLLLTGTPLQNNLAELWSLLNFILPDIFSDFEMFSKWFDFSDLNLTSSSKKWNKIINDEWEKNLITNLHTILKPFLLRRLKKTVLAGILPPKREYIVNCPLTPTQIKFYKAALNGRLKQTIFKQAIKDFFTLNRQHIGTVSNRSIRDFITYKLQDEQFDLTEVISKMEALYQKHIHKELLNKKMLNLMIQLRQIVDSTLLFFFPYLNHEDLNLDMLLKSSGKLQILQQLAPKLLSEDHKLLIFSQFLGMLDLVEDWCELNGYSCCRIDGSMKNENRKEQIKQFNKKDSEYQVFLLSTRAGGLGINLTAADSVILLDNDWNPQVDLQAMDRAHRIGQDKPTIVYRLCCDNTVENIMLTRAANKRKLEKLVIQMGKFNTLKKLALNENTFINKGSQHSSSTSNRELVQELSQLLLSGESTFGFEGAGELTEEELNILTDRSKNAYRSTHKHYPHIRIFEASTCFDE